MTGSVLYNGSATSIVLIRARPLVLALLVLLVLLAMVPTSAMGQKRGLCGEESRRVTSFEQRVYALCQQVPAGSVATYGELARSAAGGGGQGALGRER